MTSAAKPSADHNTLRLRLDKWLWAARFFKTRSIAKQAIDNGQVLIDQQRVKPAREIAIGAQLSIYKGEEQYDIEVVALSDQRQSSALARMLYIESPESIQAREKIQEKRRLTYLSRGVGPTSRPDRRDRRTLLDLKQSAPTGESD